MVYDINGREAEEVAPLLEALPNLDQYIYCSSAGVYLKSDMMPHMETDATDLKSRHKVRDRNSISTATCQQRAVSRQGAWPRTQLAGAIRRC